LQTVIDFLRTYGLPGLVVLAIVFSVVVIAIVFLSVWFAFRLSGRRALTKARHSLVAEMKYNARVSKQIVEYADSQLSGETSVAPIPRYQTQAFLEYKKVGLAGKLPMKIAEELEALYLSKESVNEAGRRQEELAFGPAAAFPNAHTLRLENLTYLRDTAHNMVEPYLDRLKTTRL